MTKDQRDGLDRQQTMHSHYVQGMAQYLAKILNDPRVEIEVAGLLDPPADDVDENLWWQWLVDVTAARDRHFHPDDAPVPDADNARVEGLNLRLLAALIALMVEWDTQDSQQRREDVLWDKTWAMLLRVVASRDRHPSHRNVLWAVVQQVRAERDQRAPRISFADDAEAIEDPAELPSTVQ